MKPTHFQPKDLTKIKQEFKQNIVEIFTIQEECQKLDNLKISVFDPGYEHSDPGFNENIRDKINALIVRHKSLLPRTRELAAQIPEAEKKQIEAEAHEEVNNSTLKINAEVALQALGFGK